MTKANFWISFFILLAVLRFPSFVQDFMDSDEAVYATVGMSVLHGEQPYRDAVERKTPLIYYTYASVFALFGEGNMLAVHVFVAIWVAITALILLLIARDLLGDEQKFETAPYWVALSYLTFSSFYHFEWQAANCEMMLDLPLALGFLTVLQARHTKSILKLFIAGVCFGVAFLYKQPALLPFIAALLASLLMFIKSNGFSWQSSCVRTAVLVSGFMVMLTLSYGYFYRHGIHEDYIYWAWKMNLQLVQDSFDPAYVITKFFKYTGFFVLGLAPAWPATVVFFKNRSLGHISIMPVTFWFMAQFAALWISGKFYTHYYFQLLAPISLMAGIGFVQLSSKWRKIILIAAIVFALVFNALWYFQDDLRRWYKYGAPDFTAIATYIEANTPNTEKIFVWGYSPEIYVLSKRRSGTRFIFCDYLTGRISGHPRVIDSTFDTSQYAAPGAWDMFRQDLQTKRPLYIIDTTPGNFHQYGKYPITKYPWFFEYLTGHYDLEINIAGADLYRRKTM